MRLGVDVGVPQSPADERSYLLVNLFGDNEVPYSNDHSEYGSMTRCELISAELESISIDFGGLF